MRTMDPDTRRALRNYRRRIRRHFLRLQQDPARALLSPVPWAEMVRRAIEHPSRGVGPIHGRGEPTV